jgi:hypothetical protein
VKQIGAAEPPTRDSKNRTADPLFLAEFPKVYNKLTCNVKEKLIEFEVNLPQIRDNFSLFTMKIPRNP